MKSLHVATWLAILNLMLMMPGYAAKTGTLAGQDDAEAGLDDNEIAWFTGSVDEAFAHARTEQKPIFLYWGAVWCPPCHEIKVTVFDTPDFVERSRLFVPVYLDGDTANAQAIGERFGVLGYPTMIVFAPDGAEITRIPGGIDIQAYATVLDLTLRNARPVDDLLSGVLDDGARLSAADCRLVAFYSWGQNESILAGLDEAETFKKLYQACPRRLKVARSRLYLDYLGKAIDNANAAEDARPLTAAQKKEALVEVTRFIDSYRAVKANIYTALFDGPKFTRALTEPDTRARKTLTAKYLRTFDRLGKDELVFKTERLYTLIGKMGFERIDNEEAALSSALIDETRALIAWADSTTKDPYERQTVINGASNVLEEAGMNDDARILLTAEIEKSRQPYYFMVSLAHVEQAAGNDEVALQWLARAYEEATGPATRFQWGSYYVVGLVEMTPEDTEAITAAVLSVVSEIEADQAFYQRSTRYLKRMERTLQTWNNDSQYGDSVKNIRSGVMAICADIPADKPARKTCASFLEGV